VNSLSAGALGAVVTAVVIVCAVWLLRRQDRRTVGSARILVPFTGGALEPRTLAAAIRIARAEDATLVPAFLIVTPLEFALDAPMQKQVAVAMPLLEAVEHQASRAGLRVDARIEAGRTPTHALERLWGEEPFDRIVAPAPVLGLRGNGFTPKDMTWLLTHAPCETIVLRPAPASVGRDGLAAPVSMSRTGSA
jgi:hypothetical protein